MSESDGVLGEGKNPGSGGEQAVPQHPAAHQPPPPAPSGGDALDMLWGSSGSTIGGSDRHTYGTAVGYPPNTQAPSAEEQRIERGAMAGLVGLCALLTAGVVVAALFFTGILGGGAVTAYGDDPNLDVLWDACDDGGYAECDELSRLAPPDSEYWRFARTCGTDADDGAGGCEELFATPTALGDDAELDALWNSCDEGDYGACDELYSLAAADSDYEEFAKTCGYITSYQDGACSAKFVEHPDDYGDDEMLDALWGLCDDGALEACDELYGLAADGSVYQGFASTCGYISSYRDGRCEVEFAEPISYGDDERLDSLWRRCGDDDYAACDQLYERTRIGSEYYEYGNRCGMTAGQAYRGTCEEQLAEPDTYGDDEMLDALWDLCAAADYAACDDLYLSSGIGTAYEGYGASCGQSFPDARGSCAALAGEEAQESALLEMLRHACGAGDLAACDSLYYASPAGSEDEGYGSSCGGIGPYRGGGCEDAHANGIPRTYGDNPVLDAQWQSCAAGDYGACDHLWRSSIIGSDYEYFAETCGGRTAAEPEGTCASRAAAGRL